MKLTLNVYITNFERFLRGDYSALTLDPGRHMDDKWQFVSEVELDIEPDTGAMIESVTKDLDQKISELHTAIQVAETRKAELLALPAPRHTSGVCDICEGVCLEEDFEYDTESDSDISRRENGVIDSQEDRTL